MATPYSPQSVLRRQETMRRGDRTAFLAIGVCAFIATVVTALLAG